MNRKINVLGATYKIEEIKEQDKLIDRLVSNTISKDPGVI